MTTENTSTAPSAHFMYLRSLSVLFFLLGFLPPGCSSLDSLSPDLCIFKSRTVRLVEIQKQFRVYPFVPVEFDLVYDVFEILQMAPSWSQVEGSKPYTSKQSTYSFPLTYQNAQNTGICLRKRYTPHTLSIWHVSRSCLKQTN